MTLMVPLSEETSELSRSAQRLTASDLSVRTSDSSNICILSKKKQGKIIELTAMVITNQEQRTRLFY